MTYNKVSVLIPTRHRTKRLELVFDSFAHTTEQQSRLAELVFRIDDDDDETREFLSTRDCRTIVGPRLDGYRSLPVFFNEMIRYATGDVFLCGNDDMIFQTKGWAGMILDAADAYPDGLFDFGVLTHNASHWPFSIISKKVTDHLGFIWDPRIFWGDIFLRDVMDAFGRKLPLPTVEIDHDWVGWAPDQTFIEADQQNIMRRDPTYWAGTHTTAVNEAIEKLRGLQ